MIDLECILRVLEERDRLYIQRFIEQERATVGAMAAQEKAVLKAETASERRFESVNEFRNTLRDQADRLMPREETSALFKAADERFYALLGRVNELDKRVVELTTAIAARRGGLSDGWGFLVGAIGLAFGLYGVLRHV